VLTATVRWVSGTSYTLTLLNQTTGRSYTTTQTSSIAQRASAEVIAEAPSDSAGVLPLATFGLVDFSDCAVDGQTLSAVGASGVDMVDSGGSVIAATSALDPTGSDFTVSDDFTAPTVTTSGLQTSATTGWKKSAVTVTLKASDGSGGSGVSAVYYTLNGGAAQRYSGAFKVSSAGSHPVRYWAVDAAGNTSTARTRYVNLDLARPTSAPRAITVARSAAVRGSAIKVPVALSDAAPTCGTATLVTRVVSRAGKTLAVSTRANVPANARTSVRLRLTAALKRGSYTVRTVATDAAGNVQASSGKARLTVR
jgi:hypothetical protein